MLYLTLIYNVKTTVLTMRRDQHPANYTRIFRPLTPESEQLVFDIQKEVFDGIAHESLRLNLRPQVTIASGAPSAQSFLPLPKTARRELTIDASEVGYLGRTLHETALCLMLEDPKGTLAREAQLLKDFLHDTSRSQPYRPHVTLARLSNLAISSTVIERLEALIPKQVTLAKVRSSRNA